MASQVSNKLIEAISQGNLLETTNEFDKAIRGLCADRLLVLRESAASSLFRENVEPDFDSAIDFILSRLENKGPQSLTESIAIASQNYNVDKIALVNFLKETFDPIKVDENCLAEEVILEMCNCLKEQTEGLIEFANNTARIVSLKETEALLYLWESLNPDNRRLMESTMLGDVMGFNKIVDFAMGFITEEANNV